MNTILDTEEIDAFKRGIADGLGVGILNEDERKLWTSYYYKRGYEHGLTLYCECIQQRTQGEQDD